MSQSTSIIPFCEIDEVSEGNITRRFAKELPSEWRPPRNLPPILRNPKCLELNRPKVRSFSLKAGGSIYTGYHQEARLGFRRRNNSAVRLAPIEQDVSAKMWQPPAPLSVSTPTRAFSNHLQSVSCLEVPQPQSNEYEFFNGEDVQSALPTSGATCVAPTEEGAQVTGAGCSIAAATPPKDVVTPSKDVDTTDKVLDKESVVPSGLADKDPKTVSDHATCDGGHLASTPLHPADVLQTLRQRAAKGILDVAHGGQLGVMLEAARAYAGMAGDTMFSLEVPATVDQSTPLPPEDTLQSMKQRAAKGILEVAHGGQLGVVLEAARANAGMAGDNMFSLEAPAAVESIMVQNFVECSILTAIHSIETSVDIMGPGKEGVSDLEFNGKNRSPSDADADVQDPLPSILLSQQSPNVTDDKVSQVSEDQEADFRNDCPDFSNDCPASSCAIEFKSAEDSSLLDGLRKKLAVRLVTAARSSELRTALTSFSTQEDVNNVAGVHESIGEETAVRSLQQLRQRAATGLASVAHAGSLSKLLQAASNTPEAAKFSGATPVVNQQACAPPPTPKASKTPSNLISHGNCGELGRAKVPVPTGLPNSSGDCTSVKSAVGRPGMFRRRHSRSSSKTWS